MFSMFRLMANNYNNKNSFQFKSKENIQLYSTVMLEVVEFILL